MRKLKFRAWDKILNHMYYDGNLNNGDIMVMDIEGGLQFSDGTWNEKDFELMQYTGLKDKNGKEIYEGDICIDGYSDVYQILWSDKHQWACKLIKTNYTLSRGLTFPLWHYDNCAENGNRQLEVIGNIYENPELLEVEK